jgi:hypothetical protein
MIDSINRNLSPLFHRRMQSKALRFPDFSILSIVIRYGSLDNIKINLREIGGDDMDWIRLAQDRGQWKVLMNTIMKHRFQ